MTDVTRAETTYADTIYGPNAARLFGLSVPNGKGPA
jgi:hypothetical protein